MIIKRKKNFFVFLVANFEEEDPCRFHRERQCHTPFLAHAKITKKWERREKEIHGTLFFLLN
jgi:hypothetical protein